MFVASEASGACPTNPRRVLQRRDEVDIPTALANSLLFQSVPPAILHEFSRHATVQYASKGKILFLQMDEAHSFYIIVSGWVKLFRETLDGNEAVVDVLNDGHIFGEGAVFGDSIYAYGAEAVENLCVIALPLALLKQHIHNCRELSMQMFAVLSRLRHQQDRELEHRDLQNAPQRIGCFLLRLCKAGTESTILHLPYDKTLIASRLGMKPETFSRALARLKQETPVNIHGASVEITSVSALSAYCCSACSSSYPCQDLL